MKAENHFQLYKNSSRYQGVSFFIVPMIPRNIILSISLSIYIDSVFQMHANTTKVLKTSKSLAATEKLGTNAEKYMKMKLKLQAKTSQILIQNIINISKYSNPFAMSLKVSAFHKGALSWKGT